SGAIVTRAEGDHLIAARVNGKYWMYFNVPDIMIATSDNLVDWTPLADSDGKVLKVLSPRPGYFDSWLVEAGPPAIITQRGIVLVYNAGNSGQFGRPDLPQRVYTGGQALFDARNPIKLIARADEPFIRPTGVRFALQKGKSDAKGNAELLAPTRSDPTSLSFDFSVRVARAKPGAPPRFLGEFTQGPPDKRFVYVNSGRRAGQEDTLWDRR